MMLAIVVMGAILIKRWDEPLPFRKGSWRRILAGAAAQTAGIAVCTGDGPVRVKIFLAAFGGSLLLACVTDSLLCQVYNFTWWISLAAALALFWENGSLPGEALGELLVFAGLQLLLRGRIYGRADSYAFCVCALALTAFGLSAAGFLTHMLTAYFLLFAVQLHRRNIDRRGNLREPAPFLPYITTGFWITLALHTLGQTVI